MMMLVSMLPPTTLSGSMVLLKPESLLMSMFSVTTKGYADIHGLCCTMKPSWWRLCYCQGSYWCEWLVLFPEAIVMSLACATKSDDGVHGLWSSRKLCVSMLCTCWNPCHSADIWDRVDVCDLCCLQKPCISPWSKFLMTVKCKETTFAKVLMTIESQLRKRTREGFSDNLTFNSPKKYITCWKSLKRLLKL